MKFSQVLIAMCLFVFACKNVDQNLVTEMEAQCKTLEGSVEKITNLNSMVRDVNELSNGVTQAVREDPNSGYSSWFETYSSLNKKIAAVNVETLDGLKKFKQTIADYQDGKLKTEEVQKELTIMKNMVAGREELLTKFDGVVKQLDGEYAKLLGGKAAPASEKKATTAKTKDNPNAIGIPDRVSN